MKRFAFILLAAAFATPAVWATCEWCDMHVVADESQEQYLARYRYARSRAAQPAMPMPAADVEIPENVSGAFDALDRELQAAEDALTERLSEIKEQISSLNGRQGELMKELTCVTKDQNKNRVFSDDLAKAHQTARQELNEVQNGLRNAYQQQFRAHQQIQGLHHHRQMIRNQLNELGKKFGATEQSLDRVAGTIDGIPGHADSLETAIAGIKTAGDAVAQSNAQAAESGGEMKQPEATKAAETAAADKIAAEKKAIAAAEAATKKAKMEADQAATEKAKAEAMEAEKAAAEKAAAEKAAAEKAASEKAAAEKAAAEAKAAAEKAAKPAKEKTFLEKLMERIEGAEKELEEDE